MVWLWWICSASHEFSEHVFSVQHSNFQLGKELSHSGFDISIAVQHFGIVLINSCGIFDSDNNLLTESKLQK